LWVASAVWANNIQNDYERDIYTDPTTTTGDAKRSMRYAGGVFLGGVAMLGVSAYLYFGKGRAREVKTTVAPVVDRNGGGLALARRF
jgi:hypothetical protein